MGPSEGFEIPCPEGFGGSFNNRKRDEEPIFLRSGDFPTAGDGSAELLVRARQSTKGMQGI
jgi:hypothetical protein